MNDERLRMAKEAVAAVRGLDVDPDSPGGAEILKHLLNGPAIPSSSPTDSAFPGPSSDTTTASDPGEPAKRLADWLGIDVERVEDVIEFTAEEAQLRIPAARLARAKADRQRVLVLIQLAVERIAYNRTEVRASRINATCADYGCMDQNLPNNVSSRGDLAARRGQRGSYAYRATQPGIQRARTLLQELFETQGELRL
jgi:hypothetical protein